MPAILFSGALCKIQQQFNGIDPQRVYIGNWGHTFFGWLVIGVVKMPLYASRAEEKDFSIMIGLMVPDVILHVLFLVVKLLILKKMGSISVNSSVTKLTELRLIKSEQDLKIYSLNYFIFADYVYSTENVLGNHPGGW